MPVAVPAPEVVATAFGVVPQPSGEAVGAVGWAGWASETAGLNSFSLVDGSASLSDSPAMWVKCDTHLIATVAPARVVAAESCNSESPLRILNVDKSGVTPIAETTLPGPAAQLELVLVDEQPTAIVVSADQVISIPLVDGGDDFGPQSSFLMSERCSTCDSFSSLEGRAASLGGSVVWLHGVVDEGGTQQLAAFSLLSDDSAVIYDVETGAVHSADFDSDGNPEVIGRTGSSSYLATLFE